MSFASKWIHFFTLNKILYCIFIVSCNRNFRISVFALNYVIVRIKGCCDLKGYALDRSGFWNAWKTSELSQREIMLRVLRKEMKYIMHAYNTPDNLVWYNAHFWCEDVRRVIWSFVLKKHGWEHWLWIALRTNALMLFIKSHYNSLEKK